MTAEITLQETEAKNERNHQQSNKNVYVTGFVNRGFIYWSCLSSGRDDRKAQRFLSKEANLFLHCVQTDHGYVGSHPPKALF